MLNLRGLEPPDEVAGEADFVLKAMIRNHSLVNSWSTTRIYCLS